MMAACQSCPMSSSPRTRTAKATKFAATTRAKRLVFLSLSDETADFILCHAAGAVPALAVFPRRNAYAPRVLDLFTQRNVVNELRFLAAEVASLSWAFKV